MLIPISGAHPPPPFFPFHRWRYHRLGFLLCQATCRSLSRELHLPMHPATSRPPSRRRPTTPPTRCTTTSTANSSTGSRGRATRGRRGARLPRSKRRTRSRTGRRRATCARRFSRSSRRGQRARKGGGRAEAQPTWKGARRVGWAAALSPTRRRPLCYLLLYRKYLQHTLTLARKEKKKKKKVGSADT